MQARIIKGHDAPPILKPIEKAEGTTQVTEQEAFNAGDWIELHLSCKAYTPL